MRWVFFLNLSNSIHSDSLHLVICASLHTPTFKMSPSRLKSHMRKYSNTLPKQPLAKCGTCRLISCLVVLRYTVNHSSLDCELLQDSPAQTDVLNRVFYSKIEGKKRPFIEVIQLVTS
jgi:hypothetical protein